MGTIFFFINFKNACKNLFETLVPTGTLSKNVAVSHSILIEDEILHNLFMIHKTLPDSVEII